MVQDNSNQALLPSTIGTSTSLPLALYTVKGDVMVLGVGLVYHFSACDCQCFSLWPAMDCRSLVRFSHANILTVSFYFLVFLKGIWFLSYALLGPQRWTCEFLFYLFMYNININGFLAIMDYISLVCWWTILPNILFKVFHWYSWVIFLSDFLVQPL